MKRYFVVGIVLAGVFFVMGQKKAVSPTKEQTPLLEEPEVGESSVNDTSMTISSIKEAMGIKKPMRCTYSLIEGDKTIQSSVIVEGEKFKAVSDMNGVATNIIFDGTTQYMWTDGQVQGLKMSKACLDELQAGLPKNTPLPAGETLEEREKTFAAATGVTCTSATEEDFSLPVGMTFVDQCEMMKQGLDTMKNSKPQASSGSSSQKNTSLPEGMKVPPLPTTFPQ